jgi:hypothetical protein
MNKKTSYIIIFSLLVVLTIGTVFTDYTKQLGTILADASVPNPGHSLSEIEGGQDLATKEYVDTAVAGITQGSVTSVGTGDGLTGGPITSSGTISVDSTVVRTTGNQTLAGTKTFSSDVNMGGKIIMNGITVLYRPTTAENTLIVGNGGTSTTGQGDTFVGIQAGEYNTSGYNNTAVGSAALNKNTTGANNTSVGALSSGGNTTGYQNTAIGSAALMMNDTGIDNVAIGASALWKNKASNNTAIGSWSLLNNVTGDSNTSIGSHAGETTSTATYNTTSNSSVYLGAQTKALADGDVNEIVIGYNAVGAGSNTATIGNDSITKTVLKGIIYADAYYYTSDIRKKENVTNIENSLSKVLQLQGISYNLKDEENKRMGFSAQELQKVYPELVKEGSDGYLSIDGTGLIAPLVEAIKEQQREIEELKEINAKIMKIITPN